MVLVVVHRWINTVDAVTIVHLTIYNNNGNKALSTRIYSAKLIHLKLKYCDTKEYARLSFSGLADSFAKRISIMNKPF
jgi:hypothetical protein